MNDTTTKNLSELIQSKFSTKAETQFGDLTIRINRDSLYATLDTLKSDGAFDFAMLVDLTVIDWVDSKPERFEVIYQLLSLSHKQRLTVRAYVPESRPEVKSVYSLWKGANFMEREAYDMFGIKFEGHPNLKRLHMYEEFKGHPLRKDYPLQLKQPRVALRAPEVSNTARQMVRTELVTIGNRLPSRRAQGTNPIIGERN
jgi:NADH-quinone oxidoreductase subunit C